MLDVTTVFFALAILLVVYCLYLAANSFMKARAISKVVDQLPGPKKHWLFGNMHQFPGPDDAGFKWIRQQLVENNSCFRMWIGPLYCRVFVGDPKTIKRILLSDEQDRLETGKKMASPWIGEGLLTSSGQKWFRNRKLLTPAFHFNILKPYIKIYNEAADVFMNKLDAASRLGSVEISQPITLLTLNIILRCAFSCGVDIQRVGTSHPYISSVINLTSILTNRILNPILHPDIIFYASPQGKLFRKCTDIAHATLEEIIAERKIALEENPEEAKKTHPDFLDILLLARDENGQGLTNQEIQDEVDTFLFAGHDTTSSALMWVLYDLAKHPDYQQECREEIDQFLGNRVIKDLEWDDLAAIRFTTQCIKESLRMHSPAPLAARQLTSEFELEGVKLLPGTEINVAIFACHHDEDIWGTDHDEFKPSRFHPDEIEERDPFAFLPFGAGQRNCIGQNFVMNEIKVVVSKLLNRFLLTVDPKHPVMHKLGPVTKATHGIKLILEPRV